MASKLKILIILIVSLNVFSCSFDGKGLDIQGESCVDEIQNGAETDTDCGGGTCPACRDGKTCQAPLDCESGICSESGICVTQEMCSDGMQNGDETDEDCGGPLCDKCVEGKSCLDANDCVSGICGEEGLCVLPLPCEDNIQNGSETDIDCGGDECGGCDTGETCLLGSDCLSKVCDSLNQCAEPSCFDTVKNGDETDINCGGSVCDPCVEGEKCLSGSDCESNICDDLNVCSGSSCIDSVRNADETDIDCGGPLCSPCIAGKHCTMGSDCLSLICDITDICTAPSCDDLVQNGDEIDTDCGGSQCPACGAGLTCFVNSDCSSGYCNGGICENTTSCKALFAVDPLMLPGDYVIETLTGPVWVYCHLDGVTAYTFHYVDGGVPTNHKDVNNSCKLAGLMLFTPTSQAHYAMGRDYLLSIGGQTGGNFLGPLGIYNPSDGDDSGWDQWCEHDSYCCRKKMIGGGAADTVSVGSCGFTSLAGQSFWASEITTLTEPNGDYDANCWLGFRYNANGDVASWNDDDCTYSYSSYLCMATDDF